jgi:hypothetical protein
MKIFIAIITLYNVGFEVLTPVVMKSFIFWDITSCCLLKVNRRLGGTCRFHLQGRKPRKNKRQAGNKKSLATFLAYSSPLRKENVASIFRVESNARNQREAGSKKSLATFADLFSYHENEGNMFLRNICLTFNRQNTNSSTLFNILYLLNLNNNVLH